MSIAVSIFVLIHKAYIYSTFHNQQRMRFEPWKVFNTFEVSMAHFTGPWSNEMNVLLTCFGQVLTPFSCFYCLLKQIRSLWKIILWAYVFLLILFLKLRILKCEVFALIEHISKWVPTNQDNDICLFSNSFWNMLHYICWSLHYSFIVRKPKHEKRAVLDMGLGQNAHLFQYKTLLVSSISASWTIEELETFPYVINRVLENDQIWDLLIAILNAIP